MTSTYEWLAEFAQSADSGPKNRARFDDAARMPLRED
jgi:cbb3-type cytochrome oxidase subunit 3